MSGELEAAGAAMSAGLIGKVIEGRGGTRHGEGKCLNCEAPVDGRYCANCGQPAHVHRTLGHVFEEFMHGVLHFDAKAWRTLPLLVARPGTLTHNYIHGKRARYISPLAMFLFTVFLMFFVFALVAPRDLDFDNQNPAALSDVQLREAIADAAEGERSMRASAAEMRADGLPSTGMEEGARAFVETRERLEAERARRENPAPAANGAQGQTRVMTGPDAAKYLAEEGSPVFIDGADELNARFREKLENPELLFYKVQQNAYKFSFLLVPISLPFVALLFMWKRGWTFYDHVVFTLYSLSFMSLLFIAASLLSVAGEAVMSWVSLVVLAAIPAHMFFHVGGTYGLGWWSALWRTFFLLIFALIGLVIFIVLMLLFGVLT